jgi:hypothetical protein
MDKSFQLMLYAFVGGTFLGLMGVEAVTGVPWLARLPWLRIGCVAAAVAVLLIAWILVRIELHLHSIRYYDSNMAGLPALLSSVT